MMKGDLEIKDCEYYVWEVNLIKWKNLLKRHKDRKCRYIYTGSVQVQIAPLQYYSKDIDLNTLLCDIKYTKFKNQIVTTLETSLNDEFTKSFFC